MATIGYEICLILSALVLIYMASKKYENINSHYWTIVILIPIVILGYWLQSRVTSPEAAELAFCFIYLDSTVLIMVTIFSMLQNFGIEVKPWVKVVGYLTAVGHCFLVWQCFGTKWYYDSVEVEVTGAGTAVTVTDGPLKIIHIIFITALFLIIIGVMVASFVRKGTYSKKIRFTYALVAWVGIIIYAVEIINNVKFTVLPYLYVLADIVIAIDYDRIHMHNISCIVSEQQSYHSNKGYVALDLKARFLSCNEKVIEFMPFLSRQPADEALASEGAVFLELLEEFKKNGTTSKKFTQDDITYVCEIANFSVRKDGKNQGYLFELRDATEEQKVLDIMEAYNTTLNAEVQSKVRHIASIQNNILVGMANMIENRDNNTGGHVKRTSDVVKILVNTIRELGKFDIDETFATDVMAAAPMHDLGKVSIDSNILCKPARLTDEEYAIMKTHSTMSGQMVKILLEGVVEQHFVDVAYNVARFHHERWDGKGYPEGLVGSMIPIEARIMAVADVYDALVSKRCYKEPMSFEQAKKIMCEGMGTQFDPNLKDVFLHSLDKLEEYYRTEN